jgi:hypothetical protein
LARHDGRLRADEEMADADVRRLLSPLSPNHTATPEDRQAAIVCLLSASEGWRDASGLAGGAFADDAPAATRLRGLKEE